VRERRLTAPLLTARTVADLLGVSTETVLRWSRCGSLPSLCLPGGAIRFRQDDLDAWLEERRRPGDGSSLTPRHADVRHDRPGRLADITRREAEEA
jgi:excisionase family DNA binding protein